MLRRDPYHHCYTVIASVAAIPVYLRAALQMGLALFLRKWCNGELVDLYLLV